MDNEKSAPGAAWMIHTHKDFDMLHRQKMSIVLVLRMKINNTYNEQNFSNAM